MKCPICNIEMKFKTQSFKSSYGFYEGLNPIKEYWYECKNCNSIYSNSKFKFNSKINFATQKQIKYIKHLFLKLKIYESEFDKFEKCNKMIYIYNNNELMIKLTKEKATIIIEKLNSFNNYDDWNLRIDNFLKKNIQLSTETKINTFIKLIENNIEF